MTLLNMKIGFTSYLLLWELSYQMIREPHQMLIKVPSFFHTGERYWMI